MIHFEITDGPDLNTRSEFKFFQNQIYLGSSSGDLWIKDPHLFASHVMLEVIGTELLIHPQKNVEYFLINGKRATNIRKLKAQDEVQIGQTKFKVLSFEETSIETKADVLNKKLGKLIESNSAKLNVIEHLTQQTK